MGPTPSVCMLQAKQAPVCCNLRPRSQQKFWFANARMVRRQLSQPAGVRRRLNSGSVCWPDRPHPCVYTPTITEDPWYYTPCVCHCVVKIVSFVGRMDLELNKHVLQVVLTSLGVTDPCHLAPIVHHSRLASHIEPTL